MDPLPVGTLTLLFSDIEGSTVLLSRLGERYGEAISAQRQLLRAAFSTWGGHEMGTEGDSFFVVFETARAAVAAALDAQLALTRHEWPMGASVRVRMGLHTGEPVRHEDGYIGMDVHRAARISATAHGAQVVLSDTTRELVADKLPAGAGLRDLGWHRLKDIDQPEHIFQLTHPELRVEFPPLKSIGAPTSLPVPATPLVGRATELEELRARVLSPGVRLVTLTGPGGVGKTRLGLALAGSIDAAFPHGVFFVPLATVSNADVMWKVVADSIGAGSDRAAPDSVTAYLSGRESLLVLDNVEQLAEAAQVVTAILAAAPHVVVIATSRRPLHVQGEREYAVPPLAVPPDGATEQIAESAAVTLFAQQAALVRPGFAITPDNADDVAAICRRLDGLPLAIELAASRVKLLPPRALLARLGNSLNLATAEVGRPSRQQTLRATIAWSHDLLTPDLERIFRRLGVFVGGADLDAVAAVTADEGADPELSDPLDPVAELLDVSLVTVTESVDGEPRVGMLQTIREFAADQLVRAGELEPTRRRHAEHYAEFAERAAAELRGRNQLIWLDRFEVEHDNLRAALSWALDEPAADGADDRRALGLRLVNAMIWFWYTHGHAADGRRWLERALDRAAADEGPQLASALHGLGVLLLQTGEHARAQAALERGLSIWRRLNEPERVALSLSSCGVLFRATGQHDLARAALDESLAVARAAGSRERTAAALANLAVIDIDTGHAERAADLLREAIAIDQQLGDSYAAAVDKLNLAGALLFSGDAAAARDLLCRLIDQVAAYRDAEFTASALELFASTAAALGDEQSAAQLAGAAEQVREKAGMPLAPSDAALLDRSLDPARERVGAQEWDRDRAAGRRLSEDQAMALAAKALG